MRNFKKINELVFNITKQIYKRHDKNFLIIIDNWKKIVGEELNYKSIPKKINNNNILVVKVENEIFLDFQYKTELFIKEINTLLEENTIYKIRLIIKN